MSIGTQTRQDKKINLCFPLINLNFQSLESRQTCQHKHTQMHVLGMALLWGREGQHRDRQLLTSAHP